MDYWAETMQDDVYLIAADGWVEAAKPRGIVEDKDKQDQGDAGPHHQAQEVQDGPDAPGAHRRALLREGAGRHRGLAERSRRPPPASWRSSSRSTTRAREEGLLADATNDKGKVTKGGVKDRLKAIEDEPDSDEERDALTRCLALIEAESAAAKAVKDAQAALDAKVLARYAKLTEAEIKTLVVEDKWLASIRAAIEGEVERLTQRLAARVKELEERYAKPLPALEQEVEAFSAKVEGHLKKMGLAWA